ncbi:MAG: ATP synthase F1 subunit gamma [bacterium]
MSQKLIELKQHIGSVENIKATTQTMSTVAAAKLARSRNKASSLRAYAEKMREIVLVQSYYVAELGDKIAEVSPLFRAKRGEGKAIFIVVGSDIGMCGSYNGQIGRLAQAKIEEIQRAGQPCAVFCKGIKSEEFFRRKTKTPILGMEKWSDEGVSISDAIKLLVTMVRFFNDDDVKEIYCAYTKFYSPVKREPTVLKMLPLSFDILATPGKFQSFEDWIYEPDPISILKELIPTYFRIQVFDMLLESYASEQGARMMAMEEASDRAEETLRGLRINYNKMRRDLITLDLLGILSAANVIELEAAKKASGGLF